MGASALLAVGWVLLTGPLVTAGGSKGSDGRPQDTRATPHPPARGSAAGNQHSAHTHVLGLTPLSLPSWQASGPGPPSWACLGLGGWGAGPWNRGSGGLPLRGVSAAGGPGQVPSCAHLPDRLTWESVPQSGHSRRSCPSCPVLFSHPGAQHCPQPRTHRLRAPGLTKQGVPGAWPGSHLARADGTHPLPSGRHPLGPGGWAAAGGSAPCCPPA